MHGNHRHFHLYVAQKGINHVSFSDSTITNEQIKNIGEALKNTPITHINLTGSSIEEKGARSLVIALKDTIVTHVDLSDNLLSFPSAIDFIEALQHTKVKSISLANNGFWPLGFNFYGETLKNTNITEINFSGNCITSRCAIEIAKALSHSNVKTIDLSNNDISIQGAKEFFKALKYTNVNKVNLSNNKWEFINRLNYQFEFSEKGAKEFCSIIHGTCISEINLTQPDMPVDTARKICQFLRGTKIQKLILSPWLQEEIRDEINAMYQFNNPANLSLKAIALASLAQNPEQAMLLKALPKNIFHPYFSNKYDERRVEDIVNDPNIAIPATELERIKQISDLYVHPHKKQRLIETNAEDNFVNPLLDLRSENTYMNNDEETTYNNSDSSSSSRKRSRS